MNVVAVLAQGYRTCIYNETAITVHLFRYPRYRLHKFAKQAVILDFNFNAFYTAQFWTLKFSWFRNNTLVNFDIHNSWVSHVRNCLLLNRMLPRNVKTAPTPMRFLASASNVYISQQNCCFSFIKSIDLMMDLIVISTLTKGWLLCHPWTLHNMRCRCQPELNWSPRDLKRLSILSFCYPLSFLWPPIPYSLPLRACSRWTSHLHHVEEIYRNRDRCSEIDAKYMDFFETKAKSCSQ